MRGHMRDNLGTGRGNESSVVDLMWQGGDSGGVSWVL
jgi:hypothetical protein